MYVTWHCMDRMQIDCVGLGANLRGERKRRSRHRTRTTGQGSPDESIPVTHVRWGQQTDERFEQYAIAFERYDGQAARC